MDTHKKRAGECRPFFDASLACGSIYSSGKISSSELSG